jgi:hypothetical protein
MSPLEFVYPLFAAVFAAGGAWAAVRFELRALRRDVDRAHQRIDGHVVVLLDHAGRLPRD